MTKSEIFVKQIDKVLVERNKNYMSLGQANKLLFEKDLISESEKKNQYLKKLLESGEIKNANQTESSPRQWRIFLSDKRLKKKKKETPKKSLVKNQPDYTNKSPNKMDIKAKNNYDWKKISIGVMILILAIIVFVESNKDTYDSDPILAYNYAKEFIKENLKAPSTAEFPSSYEKKNHVTNLGNGEYLIRSWVDSQNDFGAMIRSRWSCKIIFNNGKVQAKNIRIE